MIGLSGKISKARMPAKYIRIKSLSIVSNANSTHIGSCLSVADLLSVVHLLVQKNNDDLIFSKGHAAAAML